VGGAEDAARCHVIYVDNERRKIPAGARAVIVPTHRHDIAEPSLGSLADYLAQLCRAPHSIPPGGHLMWPGSS
jgi:hypothetical protein